MGQFAAELRKVAAKEQRSKEQVKKAKLEKAKKEHHKEVLAERKRRDDQEGGSGKEAEAHADRGANPSDEGGTTSGGTPPPPVTSPPEKKKKKKKKKEPSMTRDEMITKILLQKGKAKEK